MRVRPATRTWGVGLSNEEKRLELDLCALADENLEGHLTGYADYLPLVKTEEMKRLAIGYAVSSHSKLQDEHDKDLERWFAFGYQEVWIFWPWYRTLYVHSSLYEYERVNDTEFVSPYLLSGLKEQLRIPLDQVFDEQL